MTDSYITVLRARLTGAARLEAGEITDEEFYFARHVHLVAYADYAMKRHSYAALAPQAHPDMYEEVTAERTLNEACLHLLTTVGMNHLHPDGAQNFKHMPTPRIGFQVAQAERSRQASSLDAQRAANEPVDLGNGRPCPRSGTAQGPSSTKRSD